MKLCVFLVLLCVTAYLVSYFTGLRRVFTKSHREIVLITYKKLKMKKIKILISLIACILFIGSIANSQTLKAIVVDQESRQVIPDVFVFLDNSSTGAVTNQQGRFELKTSDYEDDLLLVFSHLNYELQSLIIKKTATLADTIFLVPSDVILDEAVVVEKAKPRVRSRWLKRFKAEFLGLNYDKALIKILNPEVLLFEQEKKKLLATSKAPLIIENKVLGYRVQFFLEDYKSYKDGDLVYSGKVFFEEIGGTKKERAKYKRNRLKVYKKSSRSFFADLVQQNMAENAYEIGFCMFSKNEEFINYDPIAPDSLLITEVRKGIFEVSINRILTITNNQLKITQGLQQNVKAEGGMGSYKKTANSIPKSYLWSKYGRIVVNEYGSILNPTEVEEAGYWASLRVATLLPLDYAVKMRKKWRFYKDRGIN